MQSIQSKSSFRFSLAGLMLACGLAASAGAQMRADDGPVGSAAPRTLKAAPAATPLDLSRTADSFGRPGRTQRQPAPVRPLNPNLPVAEQALAGGGVADNPGGGGGVADAGMTIIDFEALYTNDASTHNIGEFYYEDGFVLQDADDVDNLSYFGAQEVRWPGSTAIFNNTIGGTTWLYANDLLPFSVSFIEVANLNNDGPTTVTFTGYRFDGSTVTRTCTTGTDYNRLDTFTFSGFNDIYYVEWTQDSPYHQVDNIGLVRTPVVMDFESLAHADSDIDGHGDYYYEDGFEVRQNPGQPNPLSTFGTLESRYPGSTALFDRTANGTVTVTQAAGGAFNMHSIDIANLNNNGPTSVTFVGQRPAGGTVTRTVTTSGAPNALETFALPGFNNVSSVSWTQDSPYHQFDNIILSRGQQVLDFLKLSQGGDDSYEWGQHYREDGFRIDTPGIFATFGTDEARFPGSTSLFNNRVDEVTTLDTIDDQPFELTAIDIASLNGASPVTVNFKGTKVNGNVINQSFTTSGDGQRLETFYFPADFRNLDRVEWTQDSPFHQFDNVTLVRQTSLVDFQALEHVDDSYANEGNQYQEQGFRLRVGDGEAHGFATWGTLNSNYSGTTALFNNTGGGFTRLTAIDGSDFDLLQMDVAPLSVNEVSVTFRGHKIDGSDVYKTFKAFGSAEIPQTCEFTGFDSLEYVEWQQELPYHQFDNIVAVEADSPESCYADCDGNGSLDLFDFLCFVNAFNAAQPYANCDGNGSLDLFDFLCYVNAFNAGC